MKKIILFTISLLFIFGTNSYEELNHLAIITNIGIEKENDHYQVIYQEIIPEKEENKIKRNYRYYTNQSNTLQNAFLKLNEDTTKYIYFDHLENIIINANDIKVLKELMDDFDKNIDNFNIIYTTDSVKKVLKYSNNYQYVNSLVDDNISFREVKQSILEKEKIKMPIVKFKNDNLIFYGYIKLGDDHA